MAATTVRAPFTARLKGKVGGPTSFAAYFLRDLYQQGKLSEATIREIVQENGITQAPIEEIIAAIKDIGGDYIKQNVADALGYVAEGGSSSN